MEILQTLRSHYDTFITSLEQITAEDAVDDKNSAFFAPISAYCQCVLFAQNSAPFDIPFSPANWKIS